MSDDQGALRARIAELERALEAARAEQLLSTTILETAPAIVLRVSLDYTIEFINRVLPEYRDAPLVGQSVFAFVDAAQHAPMRRALDEAKETRQPTHYDTIARAPDGSSDWYSTTVGPIVDGDALLGLTLICTNVTHAKQVEADLRESRARLEVALDAGRVGLWRWDAQADALEADARLCDLFGLEPAKGLRRADWLRRLAPADAARLEAHLDAALGSGQCPELETSVGSGAERRWLVVRGGPMRDESGAIVGLMGGVLEVTGLRALEERVQQAQKLDALGQLSAGVAHNFNNMLAAIMPVLELGRQELPGHAGDFEQALRSARHAADLVRDLMFFSRRGSEPEGVEEPLEAVARRAAELCRRTFGRHVSLEVGDLEAARGVVVDGARTEQALVNLLLNARDAVERLEGDRRSITLTVRAVPAADARLGDARGDFVEVQVADRGPGMDEATRKRIFEPFFTTKPLGRGTGLGLPTAWAAAKTQGGYLTCSSEPGEGATFTLGLPARARTRPSTPAPRPQQPPTDATVLVIDDEGAVRRGLLLLLPMMGYRAIAAGSGEEGVRLARERPVDVVLLDRSMPGQAAERTLAELRALQPDLPVIAFSGLAEELEGATMQLGKPATRDQLEAAIRAALATRA